MCDIHLSDEERAQELTGPVAFVDELVVALTNARIYAETHPRLKLAIDGLHAGLGRLLEAYPGPSVQIGTADGFVVFQSRPLLGASMSAGRLVSLLEQLGSGGLTLGAHTTREDLTAFIEFAARGTKGIESPATANLALEQAGCRHVRFLEPYSEAAGGRGSFADRVEHAIGDRLGPTVELADDTELLNTLNLQVPARLYQNVVGVLQDAMVQSCKGDHIDTNPALGYVENVLKLIGQDTTSLMRLARYEKYDEFTFGHSIRVCFIALNFARHLTDDRQLIERIGLAALMHDIGKAWVPFEVLHSQKRLDDDERREMNMHPVHGGQILLDGGNPDPLAVAVAFSHHQNPDGTGYPNAIRAARPSGATMIVKMADVYEALTAVRPYKPSMSPTRAYRIMMDMQGHFDPSLLRRFIEVNGIYPVGSRVELSTGESARVTGQTDSPLAPIVQTERAASGERLFEEDIEILDLREVFGRNKITVAKHLRDAELAA
ncbi:MAG: HD domain-containing protein [Planctomycetota bacterium]|nr:HD domain-containing protein [Planctomycetota bacterium]